MLKFLFAILCDEFITRIMEHYASLGLAQSTKRLKGGDG